MTLTVYAMNRSDVEMAAQGSRATGPSAGLIQLTGLVQGIYAHVPERHNLTPVQAKRLTEAVARPLSPFTPR